MPTENNIIAQSERLYLRHLNFDDEVALFNIYSDKEAMKYRSNAPLENVDDAREMIQKSMEEIDKKKEYRFGIIVKATNELIGTFLFKTMEETKCEVGYSIGKKYWKLGYGYETLNTMLDYLKVNGFKQIIATTKKRKCKFYKTINQSWFHKKSS